MSICNDDAKTMSIRLHNCAILYRQKLQKGEIKIEDIPEDVLKEIKRLNNKPKKKFGKQTRLITIQVLYENGELACQILHSNGIDTFMEWEDQTELKEHIRIHNEMEKYRRCRE